METEKDQEEMMKELDANELCDDPLKWWQGAIVLGIPAVLGFVGGILAGVGITKKD